MGLWWYSRKSFPDTISSYLSFRRYHSFLLFYQSWGMEWHFNKVFRAEYPPGAGCIKEMELPASGQIYLSHHTCQKDQLYICLPSYNWRGHKERCICNYRRYNPDLTQQYCCLQQCYWSAGHCYNLMPVIGSINHLFCILPPTKTSSVPLLMFMVNSSCGSILQNFYCSSYNCRNPLTPGLHRLAE